MRPYKIARRKWGAYQVFFRFNDISLGWVCKNGRNWIYYSGRENVFGKVCGTQHEAAEALWKEFQVALERISKGET